MHELLRAWQNTARSPLTEGHTGAVTPTSRKSSVGNTKEPHLYFTWEAGKLSEEEFISMVSVT